MRAFVVLGLGQEIGLGKRLRNDLFRVDTHTHLFNGPLFGTTSDYLSEPVPKR